MSETASFSSWEFQTVVDAHIKEAHRLATMFEFDAANEELQRARALHVLAEVAAISEADD